MDRKQGSSMTMQGAVYEMANQLSSTPIGDQGHLVRHRVRAYGVLCRAAADKGLKFEELMRMNFSQIKRIKNCGAVTARFICESLGIGEDPNLAAYKARKHDPDPLWYNRKFSPDEQEHVVDYIGCVLARPMPTLVTIAGTRFTAEFIATGVLGEIRMRLTPWPKEPHNITI